MRSQTVRIRHLLNFRAGCLRRHPSPGIPSVQFFSTNIQRKASDEPKELLRKEFTVTLVGRPNVGKSSLFNRLVGRKEAIVSNIPGTTRDRREGKAWLGGLSFNVIDTGGLEDVKGQSTLRAHVGGRRVPLQEAMTRQTELALYEASVILLLVDAKEGVTVDDQHFARWLRQRPRKPTGPISFGDVDDESDFPDVRLVINKAEGMGDVWTGDWDGVEPEWERLLRECYQLGLGDPTPISVAQGIGIADLVRLLEPYSRDERGMNPVVVTTEDVPKPAPEESDDSAFAEGVALGQPGAEPLQVALVGRTNVGKSSLLNRLVDYERAVTGPMPGLTRDEIRVEWEYDGRRMQLIDTAGIRKRSRLYKAAKSANVELTKLHTKRERELFGSAGVGDKQRDATQLEFNEAERQHGALERVSIDASMRALERAHVAVVVVDVSTPEAIDGSGRYSGGRKAHTAKTMEDLRGMYVPGPLTQHDLAIISRVVDEGRAVVVVANKCDAVPPPHGISAAESAAEEQQEQALEGALLSATDVNPFNAAEVEKIENLQWARPMRKARRPIPKERPPTKEGFHFRYPVVDRIQDQLRRAVPTAEGVTVLPLSALDGRGVESLLPQLLARLSSESVSVDRWDKRVSANALQRWLKRAQERQPPPSMRSAKRKGSRGSNEYELRRSAVRIKFGHQLSTRPPTFALFLNRFDPRGVLPANYLQFLRKELRREFGLWGVPIRFTLRGKYVKGEHPVSLTKQ